MQELALKNFDNFKDEFSIYYKELQKWSKIHSLTSLNDKDLLINQILDSIKPLFFIKDFSTCIDVGSGAGFPAIPLAIARRECEFFLIEPKRKKVAFLESVKSILDLDNVQIIPKFSYEVKLKADLLTSQAVSSIKNLLESSSHLLDKNGYFLFYKGLKATSELEEAGVCNAKIVSDFKRQYVYFKKES